MQVYIDEINVCADMIQETYEIMFFQYAWSCLRSPFQIFPMEFPVLVHLDQD